MFRWRGSYFVGIAGFLATVHLGACAAHLGDSAQGRASFYGERFHGRKTASGEIYNQNGLTAAHRDLPFGTRVRVSRKDTGQAVVVRINDRGPFGNRNRIIDLSKAAARKLDMLKAGVVDVELEVLFLGKGRGK